ncbi:unnamed protein product [Symbiodinium sp. CCMP2456]|nr:unnamed protein product [Symbiodinium sp. CCMP2456]
MAWPGQQRITDSPKRDGGLGNSQKGEVRFLQTSRMEIDRISTDQFGNRMIPAAGFEGWILRNQDVLRQIFQLSGMTRCLSAGMHNVQRASQTVVGDFLSVQIATLRDPLHPSVMEGHRDFRTKDFVWSRPPTDYRASNWYIENHWALHRLRKSDSEPAKANQPWTSSAQFQACCVGGVGGGRKGRNKGSYEDDFVHQGKYVPPEFGLSQSDVTKEAEEIIKQKALERK